MSPDQVFVITLVGIAAVTVMTAAKYLFNRPGRAALSPHALDQIEARLARIEQAVDTIAVETERISEGQRFTTKLLSERAAAEQ